MKKELIEICRKHVLPSGESAAMVAEPYIPYVPESWNRTLVLAEAQNHGISSADYLDWLKQQSSDRRIERLYLYPKGFGVQPWDDGSLRIALEAAFDQRATQTAVSNAVLWSLVTDTGKNQNPSKALCERSVGVWRDLFEVLRPELVVTAGKVAENVMAEVIRLVPSPCRQVALRLPSPSAMNRISGMFDEADLLRRYPEVKRVVEAHPKWMSGPHRRNKIFFGCHAVSIAKRGLADPRR
ncbi:MAG: hypothetical protein ABIH23_25000 [bacterium]